MPAGPRNAKRIASTKPALSTSATGDTSPPSENATPPKAASRQSHLRPLSDYVENALPKRSKPTPAISPPSSDSSDGLPECGYCADVGIVRRGLRLTPDGKTYVQDIARCPQCNPEQPERIPPGRQENTFETFDLRRNPSMREAYDRCRAVAKGETWSALLTGTYGTGKTHLAIAALNLFGRGEFWKVPDLLDWLRKAAYDDKGIGIDAALRRFRAATGLLILDDLGTEKMTEWAGEQLYRILDSRYEMRLPTIITSNQDFGKLDGRVSSRYAEGLVPCEGMDVRRYRKVKGATA